MTPPTSSSYEAYKKVACKVTEIVLRETQSSGIHREKLQQALLDAKTSIQHASKDYFGVLQTFRKSIKDNSDLRKNVKVLLEEGSQEDARSCIQDVLLNHRTYARKKIQDRVRTNQEKEMDNTVVRQGHHNIVQNGRLSFNECIFGKKCGNTKDWGFAEHGYVMGDTKK